jgi:hypothetical protein
MQRCFTIIPAAFHACRFALVLASAISLIQRISRTHPYLIIVTILQVILEADTAFGVHSQVDPTRRSVDEMVYTLAVLKVRRCGGG